MDPQPSGSKRPFPDNGDSEASVIPQRLRLNRKYIHANIGIPINTRSGVIQKVLLKNFMCHRSLEVTFNPHMNFIVGRNGCCRCAVITVLVLGLGGSGGSTKRGASIKQFIKTGMSSATVTIILSNTGSNSFNFEVYGDTITVERKISASRIPCTFKIKGSNNVVQSTNREDLDRIMEWFKIHVEYPISVLNPDKALSFLGNCSTRDKYKLIMKATQLRVLWQTIFQNMTIRRKPKKRLNVTKKTLLLIKEESKDEMNQHEATIPLNVKEQPLLIIKEEPKDEMDWYEAALPLNVKKEPMLIIKEEPKDETNWHEATMPLNLKKTPVLIVKEEPKDEMNCALPIKEERVERIMPTRIKKELHLPALQLHEIERHCRLEEEKEAELSLTESEINAVRCELNKNKAELSKSKLRAAQCKVAYSSKLEFYKSLSLTVDSHQSSLNFLHRQIDNLRKLSNPNDVARRMQLKEEVALLKQQYSEIHDLVKTLNNHLVEFQSHNKEICQQQEIEPLNLSTKSGKSLKAQNDLSVDMPLNLNIHMQRQVASLKSSFYDNLPLYGSLMPVLVKEIDEAGNQGKFKRLPIGPIGAYLELRYDSWAPAIESFLGDTLYSFCVNSTNDAKTLTLLIKKVFGRQRQPAVVNSKLFDVVYDVQGYAVQAPPGMFSVLDTLVISNPAVANCLIDLHEVESILLIPTLEEATDLMSEKSRVPCNCKRAITKQGDMIYPDPNYQLHAGNVSPQAKYLHVYKAQVKTIKKKVTFCGKEPVNIEEHLLAPKQKENNSKRICVQNEEYNLRQNLQDLGAEIKALEDSEEPEMISVEVFQEMEGLKAQLRIVTAEKEQLYQQCESLKEERAEAEKKVSSLQAAGCCLQGNELLLFIKLKKVREELDELSRYESYC